MMLVIRLNQPTAAVVIFGRDGIQPLVDYVLQGIDYVVVAPVRGLSAYAHEFHLSPAIMRGFVSRLRELAFRVPGLSLRQQTRLFIGNVIRTYQLATIESFRPRVVISVADNSFDFQWIAVRCRTATAIAIANSPREISNLVEQITVAERHPAAKYRYPHYFGFGEREKRLFESLGHHIENYYPVGPLRAGYYYSKDGRNRLGQTQFDLCLISQFDLPMFENGVLPEIKRGLERLHEFVRRFCEDHRLTLCIATRSNSEKEKAYFRNRFGKEVVLSNFSVEGMSTYRLIDEARLAVTLDSSAGREAFAAGRKVLFTNYSGNAQRDFFAAGPWFDTGDYDSFSEKALRLLASSDEEYGQLSIAARGALMRIDAERPAHETIRRAIATALASSGPVTTPLVACD